MEHRYLEYQDAVSDKFYRITVGQTPGGNWVTNATWGRRGSTGQSQAKYAGPSEVMALAAMEKYASEKRAKGYVDASDPLRPAASSSPAKPFISQATGPASSLVPRFPAMKAAETNVDWAQLDNFVMEEKFDGHRAGLVFDDGFEIVVRNVYGEDKGKIENMPHIKGSLRNIATAYQNDLYKGTLIDGELVGLTLEETTHLLGIGGKTDPRLRFVAFDLPFLAGEDLRDQPWLVRRGLLADLLHTVAHGEPVELAPFYPPTLAGVEGIWARDGEGVILKPINSQYVAGGRGDWIKIKEHHTADAVITGFVEGTGKYVGKVGALELSQLLAGQLTYVTKISGFSDLDRTHMTAFWDEWVGTVVEFEYQRKTGNSYRHPRFSRRRLDKKVSDCRWEASA